MGEEIVIKGSFWGVVHNDGTLSTNLIRSTRKQAMEAQLNMFPLLTREMIKQRGFKIRKLTERRLKWIR